MNKIQEEIVKRGKVLPGNILKVNSFLNHQLDPMFLNEMALEWYEMFKNEGITKIVTIESSGIALATLAGLIFKVPVVFAKKIFSSNMGNAYTTTVYSYTKDQEFNVCIEKAYLAEGENVLIIDDFLANGNAIMGLIDLIKQANAYVVGIGVAIEKGFQQGGKLLRGLGYNLKSLAIIESMDPIENK